MSTATITDEQRAEWRAEVSQRPMFMLGDDFSDCEHTMQKMREALSAEFYARFGVKR
jgi:hypothetical protein